MKFCNFVPEMEILIYDKAMQLEGLSVATIGVFDGVHRGHRFVFEQLADKARERKLISTVITFDRHPLSVVCPDKCPPLLTTLDERLQLLCATGVQRCVVLPFTEEMAGLAACDFMLLMRQQLGVKLLLTGYDNRFGHDRSAGFSDYVRYGQEMDMDVEALEPCNITEEDCPVSSSMVRRLLADGALDKVHHCLGRDYSLEGQVVSGEQIGMKIGYPTANLSPDSHKLLPKAGVYAVWATIGVDGPTLPAMMNIGHCPTFGGRPTTLEVHLFDYNGNLYGQTVRVRFVGRLRDEQRFADASALKAQLAKDQSDALQVLRADAEAQETVCGK